MFYFDTAELRSLLQVAYDRDRMNHLAILTTVVHALRISELRALTVDDLDANGQLFIKGKKEGLEQLSPLHISADPLFDQSPLPALIHGLRESGKRTIFGLSRQRYDQIIREYCREAGINARKAHWHTLRHSSAMLVWSETQSLGAVKQALRHKSYSTSLIYLAEADNQKATQAMGKALGNMARAKVVTA